MLAPKMDSIMTYIHIKVKLCSAWDHWPVYATSEDEGQGFVTQQQKQKGRAGSKSYDEEAGNDFKRTLMDQKGEAQKRRIGDDSNTC